MTQLEGEMDQLHHLQYSTDFSTDVNRKMQIPTRLSMEPTPAFDMDPPSPTNKLNFDANSYEGSPAHAMNVPDRILIAGDDHHVGARQAPRNLDLDNITPFPQHGENVGLTTPPRILSLDEVSFPTVGDAKSAMKSKNNGALARQSTDTNSSMIAADGPPSSDVVQLQRRIIVLGSKVDALEEASQQRDQREKIVLGFGILYLVFKGLRFLFRSPYP